MSTNSYYSAQQCSGDFATLIVTVDYSDNKGRLH